MHQAARRPRKPAKLSDPLARSLHLYALAATASGFVLAANQPCQAGVVYTPAHRYIGRDSKMGIDFNHDGNPDVVIREIPWNLIGYPGNMVSAVPEPKGGIETGLVGFADELGSGAKIGASDQFLAKSAYLVSATDSGVYYHYLGSWSFPTAKGYLGVRFMIDGETHYGWARVNVRFDQPKHQFDVVLTGYAYETQPNTLIRAGDMGQITEPEDRSQDEKSENVSAAQPETEDNPTLGALAAGANSLPLWRRRAARGQ